MKRDKSGRFVKSKSKGGGKSTRKPYNPKRTTGKRRGTVTKWKPNKVLTENQFAELFAAHEKRFNLYGDDYNSTGTNYPNVQYIYSKDGRGLKPKDKFGVYFMTMSRQQEAQAEKLFKKFAKKKSK